MHLPEEFKTKMKELLNDEYEAFISSYSESPNQGIRANTLKIERSELMRLLAVDLSPVPWCPDGFYYPEAESFRPGKSPLYHAGLFYIQEPSAMAPVSAFDIEAGHKVLDLCAAPGGKSVHAAGKLKGRGLLVSNDVSASRVKALVKNIELAGITNAIVLNETPERLSRRFYGYFDRIIVDAPCSGEGMFRKDSGAAKSWAAHKSASCTVLQREILYYAAKMLAPGGKIMYSTCTFAPEENELMINEFLKSNKFLEPYLIDFDALGLTSGFEAGSGRIWPHKQRGEGHFLACVKRTEDSLDRQGSINAYSGGMGMPGFPVGDIDYFYVFCNEYLNITPKGNYIQYKNTAYQSSLYLQPDGLPSLERIRIARSGLYLGDIKTKRFEPSQAFAMSLRREDARLVLDFSEKSQDIIRYLKGESFEVSAEDGWNLVCCCGYPVGWAKVSGLRIKNKYSRSWLMD